MPPVIRPAKSLEQLRKQINALRPTRDKTSDGGVGDTSHKARKSDHNPNQFGVYRAIDIDEDLSQGEDAMPLVNALVAARDPRVSYIIYEGRMIRSYRAKDGTAPWTWTKYTGGTNPHRHHFHISVHSTDRGLYDDATPWDLSAFGPPQIRPVEEVTTAPLPSLPLRPEIRLGARGEAVKRLQLALRARNFIVDADGDFGPATLKAVKQFQASRSLGADGIVGKLTWKALGL